MPFKLQTLYLLFMSSALIIAIAKRTVTVTASEICTITKASFLFNQPYRTQTRIRSGSLTRIRSIASSSTGNQMEDKSSREINLSNKQHLVLIGGGHAHIQVIKALNSKSRPSWLSVTLIDLQASASYSGMVPGCVAKLYEPEETLLQLKPLAEWAGLHFMQSEVIDVDLTAKVVHLNNNHENDPAATPAPITVPFDCICLDIGSTSRGLTETKGALEYTIPTRPISKLVERINLAELEMLNGNEDTTTENTPTTTPHVVVVGGGAAGIELAMSMMGRWKPLFPETRVSLIHAGNELMPDESQSCRDALQNALKERGIEVCNNCIVKEITKECIYFEEDRTIGNQDEKNVQAPLDYTHCIWATGAGAHPLARTLQKNGLDTTEHGWFKVNQYLQSTSHPYVFAGGDCCSIQNLPFGQPSPPKAGVYAVRSGPILIENLTGFTSNSINPKSNCKLIKYEPQTDFLKLIACGDGKALGFRFGIPIYGKWVWELKDAIDKSFMNLFTRENLPDLDDGTPYDSSQYDANWKGKQDLLPPDAAAELLLRTDDNVDYEQAWYTLRTMTGDDKYREQVLKHAHKIIVGT